MLMVGDSVTPLHVKERWLDTLLLDPVLVWHFSGTDISVTDQAMLEYCQGLTPWKYTGVEIAIKTWGTHVSPPPHGDFHPCKYILLNWLRSHGWNCTLCNHHSTIPLI